ncbi:MAG: RimK family alpha-L-glutamate ligase [Desulfatitalea sp.]|nr:RimK family alpha-L-glutamate ligase [Desulfatitalea sp.]NNK01723.1 RimK family alpha-L-glutamate ligase [Desulfatitalea sp.]
MEGKRHHIGVITVRGLSYPPTRRLAEAAAARNCRIVAIHPYQVWPAIIKGRSVVLGDIEVGQLRAVMPRQGAEIRDACLPLISYFEQMDLAVINRRHAIELVKNKYDTLRHLAAAGLPVLDTVFLPSADGFSEALRQLDRRTVVLKPVSDRQGNNIHRVDGNDGVIPEELMAELHLGRGLLCQAYLPPEGRRDYRFLVIGGRVAAAMQQIPPPGEFRANIHLGAEARPVSLSPAIARLAQRAVEAVGLQIAGVDIMVCANQRIYINEVNYTPGFRGLEQATGLDIAGAVIDYIRSGTAG